MSETQIGSVVFEELNNYDHEQVVFCRDRVSGLRAIIGIHSTVSSQTGCAVGCKFCFTASIRRNRNLAAAEIVGQVLAVQEDVKELSEDARVTNIVFMGMGEPLLNYDHVLRSCRILLDPKGMDFSSRRITISTSGIVPRIHACPVEMSNQQLCR